MTEDNLIELENRATAGDALSQFRLAFLYVTGKAGPVSSEKAVF